MKYIGRVYNREAYRYASTTASSGPENSRIFGLSTISHHIHPLVLKTPTKRTQSSIIYARELIYAPKVINIKFLS